MRSAATLVYERERVGTKPFKVRYGVTANIAAFHDHMACARQLGVRFPVSEFFFSLFWSSRSTFTGRSQTDPGHRSTTFSRNIGRSNMEKSRTSSRVVSILRSSSTWLDHMAVPEIRTNFNTMFYKVYINHIIYPASESPSVRQREYSSVGELYVSS